MGTSARAIRLADRIKVIVAELLERRIKDPRLGFVTITEVRVTGDCQHATVFYTVLGDMATHKATAAALASARGVVRTELGRVLGVRLVPTIEFVLDTLPEGASAIEEAIRLARARDAAQAALAAGAEYAGEADPYRHPEVEIEDAAADDAPEDDADDVTDAT